MEAYYTICVKTGKIYEWYIIEAYRTMWVETNQNKSKYKQRFEC